MLTECLLAKYQLRVTATLRKCIDIIRYKKKHIKRTVSTKKHTHLCHTAGCTPYKCTSKFWPIRSYIHRKVCFISYVSTRDTLASVEQVNRSLAHSRTYK